MELTLVILQFDQTIGTVNYFTCVCIVCLHICCSIYTCSYLWEGTTSVLYMQVSDDSHAKSVARHEMIYNTHLMRCKHKTPASEENTHRSNGIRVTTYGLDIY